MATRDNGIQAVLLSGFLGSGKTTLLNRLLSQEEDFSKTVVIMNEFGNISIDGMLVDRDVEMVELVNGCICCTLQLDFRKQIELLVKNVHPRRLIMEATGLADSMELIKLFAEYTQNQIFSSYRLVAVIDGQVWPMRHILGEVFNGQLACADLILFNKIDTLDDTEIKMYLDEVQAAYPDATIEPTAFCQIDSDQLETVVQTKFQPQKDTNKILDLFDSTGGWSSFSFIESRPLDEAKFQKFMKKFEAQIFRLKGFIKFENHSLAINYVNGNGEKKKTDPILETKLVAIGRLVNMENIQQQLIQCIA